MEFVFEGAFYYVLIPLLSLMLVIVVHEMGHYMVARRFGVRIDKFSFGFGREIIGRTDRRGTRWSLSLWPLGGFVKIFGDVDPDDPLVWSEEEKRRIPMTRDQRDVAFCFKPIWQRALIILAGPLFNFVFFMLVLFTLFISWGEDYVPPIVNALDIHAAGYESGIKLGDKIVEIDGAPIRRWFEIHIRTYYDEPRERMFKILRDGEFITLPLTPKAEHYTDKKGVERAHGRAGVVHFKGIKLKEIASVNGVETQDQPEKVRELLKNLLDQDVIVGIQFREDRADEFLLRFPSIHNKHLDHPEDDLYDIVYVSDPDKRHYLRHSPAVAVEAIIFKTYKFFDESIKLIGVVLKGKTEQPAIGGVTKIAEFSGDSAKSGIYSFIVFLAYFSLIIGFMNLMPIPLLDGGYLVFLGYEALVGKPLSQRVQDMAIIIGLVFLGGIMIFANVSDLVRLLR